jgi:transposase
MPKFIPYNHDQNAMVVINFRDQLQPGTFEHAIHYLIHEKLDLSIFDYAYHNKDGGRPAYNPAILLSVVLFAYSKGITSSREIEWCCTNNIIFKALSCDTVPHFTTMSSFISSHPQAIESLFEQILLVCHEQGLLGNELFAIDGCKMPSNASKEWSGTFKELQQKRAKLKKLIRHHMREHRRIDKTESADAEKQKRTTQTIETLSKAHDKIDKFLKTATPRMGQAKRPTEVKSNITDNESAKMTTSKGTIQGYNGIATVDKKHQIVIDAQAFGAGQEHHTLQPVIERIKVRYQKLKIARNIYRKNVLVTADTGFANEANMEYLHDNKINAYVPDNKFRSRDPKFADQKTKYGKRQPIKKIQTRYKEVIPASEFHLDAQTKTCICPTGETMWLKREGTDRYGKHRKLYFEGRLSKCRVCPLKTQCMQNPDSANHRSGHGRQVSFIIDKERKNKYTEWMKVRVDSELGKMVYSHRMSTVEPVFANIGTNKGLKRFSLRGRAKVQGQWQLFCIIHNIEKLANYGDLTRAKRK